MTKPRPKSAVAKPQPKPRPAKAPLVQATTRMTPAALAALQDLAKAEGLTMQQLGEYAYSLALDAYGRGPLPGR